MFDSVFVDVDFNGIVIFDYPSILDIFEEKLLSGQNILSSFVNTEKGDEVLDKGICLPIMGIHDGGYLVRVFVDEEPLEQQRRIIFCDKYFYLNVKGKLMLQIWRHFGNGKNFQVGRSCTYP